MAKKINFGLLFIVIFTASCINTYEEGIRKFKAKDYESALWYLKNVDSLDMNYDSAQIKIAEIKGILKQIQIDKKEKDSIELIDINKNKIESFKTQITKAIESINTFDGSKYRNEVSSIEIEIALFAAWANIVKSSESYSDNELQKLSKALKSKITNLQKAEFPKMRKAYGEILKNKLWIEDIKVTTKGTGYTTLEFTGAVFAANKNKQETQQTLSEMLHLLRFKRINYKWYDYDNEYTYYSVETKADGELVILE